MGFTCQKSSHVFSNGPCAAMYRFVTPLAGISICKNNDDDDDEEDNNDHKVSLFILILPQ